LSDPKVIDMNPVGRWLLLNFIILPFRPKKSAHAYQAIWGANGSPLLHYSKRQRELLEAKTGLKTVLAMRYGNPSLAAAMKDLEGVDEVVLAPLYPQEAMATTGSTLEAAMQGLEALPQKPRVRTVKPFFAHPAFVAAWAGLVKDTLARTTVEHVVFSYHGLPERQVKAADASGTHCLASAGCCERLSAVNAHCYRAQCFATTRGIAAAAGLSSTSSCFQSRLGRVPWIQPYTEAHLTELAQQGKKRIAVACPAFVSDCLETLEEVGLRMRAHFLAAGGEDLVLVPCLNDDPRWIEALGQLVVEA
jgi:ferrochelatase